MMITSSSKSEPRFPEFSVEPKKGRGGRRYQPYAFTEQRVAMLSTVLNSERAIEVNIAIMRAFVRLHIASFAFFAPFVVHFSPGNGISPT